MNDIYTKTKEIFMTAIGSEIEIMPDTLLKKDAAGEDLVGVDLGLSSIQIIEILIEVESHFNIEISEEAIVKLRTFEGLVVKIEELIQKNKEEVVHLEALRNELF